MTEVEGQSVGRDQGAGVPLRDNRGEPEATDQRISRNRYLLSRVFGRSDAFAWVPRKVRAEDSFQRQRRGRFRGLARHNVGNVFVAVDPR
jgi:hypothetical protein